MNCAIMCCCVTFEAQCVTCDRFKDDRVHKEREVYISSDILKERHNCDVVIGQMNDLPATSSNTMNWTPLSQRTKLRFDSDSKGPMVSDSSSSRCDIATIPLPAGECIRFKLTFNEPTETKLQYSNKRFDPFPVPTYPSYFLGVDRTTGGNWIGTYGSSGYYLAAFDGTDKHRFNVSTPFSTFDVVVLSFDRSFLIGSSESIRTLGQATTIFGLLLLPQTILALCRCDNQCASTFHSSPRICQFEQ